jgi:hypothetical protein
MSLPYHIGNGWFGGFLPATVFAAATGNIYSGLWCVVAVAVATMSLVVGFQFPRPRMSTLPRPDRRKFPVHRPRSKSAADFIWWPR